VNQAVAVICLIPNRPLTAAILMRLVAMPE
jgi:hypothetical protein